MIRRASQIKRGRKDYSINTGMTGQQFEGCKLYILLYYVSKQIPCGKSARY